MEDTISNPSMEPLLFSVDPISLLLSQNSDNNSLCKFERGPRYGEYARLRESKLRLKREYEKILKEEEERFFGGDQTRKKPATKQARFGFRGGGEEEIRVFSPEKNNKQTRFGFNYNPAANPNPRRMSSSSSSSLAQSVPDFSAMIRKENRRPVNSNLLPRRTELTPPSNKSRNAAVFAGSARGSMSAGEKKSKAMMGMARKSYATVEDLKKISMAAASAINGGGGGGRKSIGGAGEGRKSLGGGGRTILGYRQIY
ncbi:hypothetical protein EUTSA_v10019032mg [Eutrema salsugineum]|uniref:Uncharacterized protein n=1 Tax=Eutrema salsugineum TaxID=72664 RepID=V4KCB3_EUTSA|nr:uncharacterized protein LOC18008267 [Eutrema salsugineum]ESQ28749.1 hypothetical protein EUTSA_v10019032mg [Eutrema salsugineum]